MPVAISPTVGRAEAATTRNHHDPKRLPGTILRPQRGPAATARERPRRRAFRAGANRVFWNRDTALTEPALGDLESPRWSQRGVCDSRAGASRPWPHGPEPGERWRNSRRDSQSGTPRRRPPLRASREDYWQISRTFSRLRCGALRPRRRLLTQPTLLPRPVPCGSPWSIPHTLLA